MASLFKFPVLKGVTKATAKQKMLKQLICSSAPEQALRYHGYRVIAGVDEVGRGALFGPVVAAAVILPEKTGVLARMGLKDSKQMDRAGRERLDLKIRSMAIAVGVAEVDAETIDRVNIYQASRLAMLLAVESMGIAPDHLIIDAMHINHPCAQTKLYYGDALCLSIAAASVVAKVHRDALMRELDVLHPQYGLASHKGYGTPEHRRALAEHGPCAFHRRSFAPVSALDPQAALEARMESGDLFLDEDLLKEDLLTEDLLKEDPEFIFAANPVGRTEDESDILSQLANPYPPANPSPLTIPSPLTTPSPLTKPSSFANPSSLPNPSSLDSLSPTDMSSTSVNIIGFVKGTASAVP